MGRELTGLISIPVSTSLPLRLPLPLSLPLQPAPFHSGALESGDLDVNVNVDNTDVASDDGAVSAATRRQLLEKHGRHLTKHEQTFHAHVRKALPAFGHIHFPKSNKGLFFGNGLRKGERSLEAEPSDAAGTTNLIIQSVAATNAGVNVAIQTSGIEAVETLLGADFNESLWTDYGNEPITLSAKIRDDATIPTDAAASTGTTTAPDVQIRKFADFFCFGSSFFSFVLSF